MDLLKNLEETHKDCPRAALVIWEDAFEITEDVTWLSQEVREYSPHVFKQVGFIMLDCPQGVHLTSTWSPSLISSVTQIPRGMILSLTYLT